MQLYEICKVHLSKQKIKFLSRMEIKNDKKAQTPVETLTEKSEVPRSVFVNNAVCFNRTLAFTLCAGLHFPAFIASFIYCCERKQILWAIV